MARTGSIRGVLSGARLPLEGFRMLRRERSLWALAAVPLAISVATCAAAVTAVLTHAPELHAFVTSWMPVLAAGSWISWLWIGPARAGLALLGILLFLGVAAAAVVAALLLASIVAAPFLDVLSRRVEAIVSGTVRDVGEGGVGRAVRAGARAAVAELRRTLFFLALQATILFLGFVVPGGQVVAAPALAIATMLFLPLDYASYTLDRRGIPFRARRRWVLDRAPLMLGYGGAAFVAHLVPGVNLLLLPVLVVGGTLLALRHPVEA
jgi:CysZ protein